MPERPRTLGSGLRATRLSRIEARLVAYDWPWAHANAEAVAANWRARLARTPAMFDGPVLLSCAHSVADGTCRVELFETTYAPFIAYRDACRAGRAFDGRVANAFAAIVPWTGDGAVLLGEMGAHTANAGELYFPCGTPDRDDVLVKGPGAHVDLEGSAARELFEETGLVVPSGAAADWVMLDGEGMLAFLRPVHFPEPARILIARIARRLQGEVEPELAGIRAAYGPADIDPDRAPGFVRAYLADAFA